MREEDANKILKGMLQGAINLVDSGYLSINKEALESLISIVNETCNKSIRISKYEFCQKIHAARSTFDKYVAEGKIPPGRDQVGFKEKYWTLKDVIDFKNSYRK